MMKSISANGRNRFANSLTFAVLAVSAHVASVAGQGTRVSIRGTSDTLPSKMDSSRVAANERRASIVSHIDSLVKLQNDTPIGSPEFARIQRELETSIRSLMPGATTFVGMGGSFSVMGAQGTAEMRKNAMAAPRVFISVAPRGWIGLDLDGFHRDPWQEADGIYVQYFEYPTVIGVDANSPAGKSGVKFGDMLLAYDGVDLRRNAINLTRLLEPGKTLAVKLRRDGETKDLSLLVEKAPPGMAIEAPVAGGMLGPSRVAYPDTERRIVEGQARAGGMVAAAPRAGGFGGGGVVSRSPIAVGRMMPSIMPSVIPGARLANIDSAVLAVVTQQKATHGIVVTDVSSGSPAARIGLVKGDIIVSVDEMDVISLSQLYRELNARRTDRSTQLVVLRDKKFEKLTIDPR